MIPTGVVRMSDGHNDFCYCEVYIKPASAQSVMTVLAADPTVGEGHARSEWVWIRFANGDLVLATFPQDETYFATEMDHP